MDNREQWWPYKVQCVLMYGEHPSITYPLPGYVHINTVELCHFLGIPGVRLRRYLETAQELDMIEDLKVTRGFISLKVVYPRAITGDLRSL